MSMRNNVQDEPLCPNCGELLELEECDEPELDYNFFDYVKPCWGECPKCGKSFRWLEVWDYKGVIDIEAAVPDEDDREPFPRHTMGGADMMALNP